MNRPLISNNLKIPDDAKEVYSGVRYKVFQWSQKMFDGSYKTYEEVSRNDTVIIIPVIGEEVIMVKEKQPHWDASVLNLVAGGVEDSEDLEDGARRELEEETGMIFKDFYLVQIERAASSLDWHIYTFIAKNLTTAKEKKLDTGEQNEVIRVSFDELLKLTRQNKLYHRARILENFIVQNRLNDIFDLLHNPEKYQIEIN